MADKERFNLTKLDGGNFALWKYGVSFLIEAQELMGCIDGTDMEPDKGRMAREWKEWKRRQSKAAVILLSSVDQALHVNLVNCTTPEEIWKKLHALYGDTSADAKQRCWQQFYEFRIKSGEPIATQIEKFETICKRLSDAGEETSDVAVMSKLLSSLPSRFSAFTMAWECTAKEERKKDNLIARIIREDKRLTTEEEDASSLALQVKSLQLKLDNQSGPDSSVQKAKKRKPVLRKIEERKRKSSCNYCHEAGHWYRECKKRIADEKNNGRRKSDASGTAYVCDISAFFSETTDRDDSVWLADSGASMHMTFRREFFRELGPVKSVRFVKVAGDRVLPVAGVGTIDIQASVNNELVDRKLTEVFWFQT
ncbi:Retrovirus-related Pol polyprotein from transposon TNT 1-94 [Anthophora retusa]